MNEGSSPRFLRLLKSSGNQTVACVCLVLSWLALSDGPLGNEEQAYLRVAAGPDLFPGELRDIEEIALSGEIQPIQLACEFLKGCVRRPERERLLEVFVLMALQDGRLTMPELHILRFLADFLDMEHELNAIHHAHAGGMLPPLADPSSRFWWQAQGNQGASNHAHQRARHHVQPDDGLEIRDRWRALSILGLDDDATHEQIKVSFRRMAREHHPDRFQACGQEAFERANTDFIRIKKAYEYLINNERSV